MDMIPFTPSEKMSLLRHPHYDEAWVEKTIKSYPEMLGLGALSNFQSQVTQQRAGRLDLLADNAIREQRFVIELMLGKLDASHLMRVMDYWLRRKNQEVDSDLELVAVLVAEEVLESRYYILMQFLAQKLGLDLPLVVIEMTALKVASTMTLTFSKIIDSSQEEAINDDLEEKVPTDRKYWVDRSSEDVMQVVDSIFIFLREIDPALTPRYNTSYIGVGQGNRANNFAWFQPNRKFVRTNVKITDAESWQPKLIRVGVEVTGTSVGRLRFSLKKEQLDAAAVILRELLRASYKDKFSDTDE